MKDYIGDGVYVEWDGFGFALTTENGIEATNRIVLELEVYEALTRFVSRVTEHVAAERSAKKGGR